MVLLEQIKVALGARCSRKKVFLTLRRRNTILTLRQRERRIICSDATGPPSENNSQRDSHLLNAGSIGFPSLLALSISLLAQRILALFLSYERGGRIRPVRYTMSDSKPSSPRLNTTALSIWISHTYLYKLAEHCRGTYNNTLYKRTVALYALCCFFIFYLFFIIYDVCLCKYMVKFT